MPVAEHSTIWVILKIQLNSNITYIFFWITTIGNVVKQLGLWTCRICPQFAIENLQIGSMQVFNIIFLHLLYRTVLKGSLTLRTVESRWTFDGIVDNYHSLAVVTVVAIRAWFAAPLGILVLMCPTGAQDRCMSVLWAVVTNRAGVRGGSHFTRWTVVAGAAVTWKHNTPYKDKGTECKVL